MKNLLYNWWNGSDLFGWIAPILILIFLAVPVGIIWIIIHFITKYW
jgi:hypothetical protein